jgi:hypothetical protein
MDCRLLREIAAQEPHFRQTQISLLPYALEASLDPVYVVDIFEAWERLGLGTAPESVVRILHSNRHRFGEACEGTFLPLHAEMQLVSHDGDPHTSGTTIDYFGCSKKSCLVCETFLNALLSPITIRGGHEIYYPAWGVPCSDSGTIDICRSQELPTPGTFQSYPSPSSRIFSHRNPP